MLFTNIGTDAEPTFDAGVYLTVGPSGEEQTIDVGYYASPYFCAWDEDGRRDLIVGCNSGHVHLFCNEGTDTEPLFTQEDYVLANDDTLRVPTLMSSPLLMDLDDDGHKDLLCGNAEGQVLLYSNQGTNDAPVFGDYSYVESNFVPIDLMGTAKSRVSVCDWTGDGYLDLLIGTCYGNVHLFQGRDPNAAPELPAAAAGLLAPWPNPFNPRVTLPFELARDARLRLSILDAAGRQVASLADGFFAAGSQELVWQAVDDAGRPLPSGLYVARLEAEGQVTARKLMLLK